MANIDLAQTLLLGVGTGFGGTVGVEPAKFLFQTILKQATGKKRTAKDSQELPE
jgi:hypothetical protein